MHAQPQEEVEEHDVEAVVQSVTASKAEETTPRRTAAKREIAGQEEIAHKTKHIASSVSHVQRYPALQEEVDAVMHSGRKRADDAETHKLHEAFIPPEAFRQSRDCLTVHGAIFLAGFLLSAGETHHFNGNAEAAVEVYRYLLVVHIAFSFQGCSQWHG